MDHHRTLLHPPVPPASTADEQDILDNMDGRMHGPTSGFIEKYFDGCLNVRQDAGMETQEDSGVSGRLSPDGFLSWLSHHASLELDGTRGSWHICSGDMSPGSENTGDGARLLLTVPTPPSRDAHVTWDRVQGVGQFYQNGRVDYQDGLVCLCHSAHQVFTSQPLRLFLHGFYIRGSVVEFWVFDRSGLFCSEAFDMRKDFNLVSSALARYRKMTNQDLGRTSIMETDEGGSYVILNGAVPLGKLYLESQPIASRESLVGNGMTCYRARRDGSEEWRYVVKFKWRWARDRPEDELLRLAEEKGVWGAISLDYYEEFESTAHLRRGLRWGTHRKFTRTPLDERCPSTEVQRKAVPHDRGGLQEYTEDTGDYFQNRILTCTVTSPVGRPLHTFQSLTELLQVFRDAIMCHRSLLHDAKILHQDISHVNIIILDNQDEGKPKGILIDLDSAIELAQETEPGITGNRPFMAIGVLRSECHTYRHDLESFLYVFLWAVITNHTENPPETSKLRQWSNGDWNELEACKSMDMEQDGFRSILEEFTQEFHSLKPLAKNLHQILFPLRDGAIWTGTDDSPEAVDRLYDGIVGAFEEAIAFEAENQTK